jgi:hypothetical protein
MQAAASAGGDPLAALRAAGVAAPDSAVHYLTPAQEAEVLGELERAAAAMDATATQAAAFFLADRLARARLANGRVEERAPGG